MQNYERYKSLAGITNADIINALKPVYPGFSKIALSLASNPLKYGLCLIPEAEKLLTDKYGIAEGLAFAEPIADIKRTEPKRTKPNRISFRVDDELFRQIKALMDERGFSSWQDFLSVLMTEILEKRNGRQSNL